MKTVRFTADAAKELRRHGNMANRIREAIGEYAADQSKHANNVTKMVGSSAKRMVLGNFRVIFEENDSEIVVTKTGPRGGVYKP